MKINVWVKKIKFLLSGEGSDNFLNNVQKHKKKEKKKKRKEKSQIFELQGFRLTMITPRVSGYI